MTFRALELSIRHEHFAVCKVDPHDAIPAWACRGEFFSITRTAEELSIVCLESAVPAGIKAEPGWRAFRVVGTQDFTLVGVLASLTAPLAAAKISLFAVSTFDTDYLLVKGRDLDRAIEALVAVGHVVRG